MIETERRTGRFLAVAAGGLAGSNVTHSVTWVREHVLTPAAHGTREFFIWLGHQLRSPAAVAWWVVWLLALLALPTVWGVLRFIFRRRSGSGGKDWHNFRQFLFLGVGWRWRYDVRGTIEDVVGLCPFCQRELARQSDLRAEPSVRGGVQDVTVFWCDDCKKERLRQDGTPEATAVRVRKEVERLIHSGDWQAFVR